MKNRKWLCISILLIILFTWNKNNYSPFHSTLESDDFPTPDSSNIQNDMDILGSPEYLTKIDPQLRLKMENSGNSSEIMKILVTYNDLLERFPQYPLSIQVLASYQKSKTQLLAAPLKNLEGIAQLAAVKSIWWDLPIQSSTADHPQNSVGTPSTANFLPTFINFTREIGARDLWRRNVTGRGVVIAILDTGVDISGGAGDLDDFDGNPNSTDPKFIGGVSMVPAEPLYYTDLNGRGSFHAGLACGTGDLNRTYIGVAPGAYYLNVKVYDSVGITYLSFIVSGIEWAINHDADIILFCTTIPGLYLDPVCQAIDTAVDSGVVVIAPVGDDGPSYMSINTPGQANRALKLGAYDSNQKDVWTYSSRGPSFDFSVGPHILAPGVDIIGPRTHIFSNSSLQMISNLVNLIPDEAKTFIQSNFDNYLPENNLLSTSIPMTTYGDILNTDTNYVKSSGTGAAAAITAGAVALLLDAFPLSTPVLLMQAVIETATPISYAQDLNAEGAGLLNVSEAFNWLSQFFSVDLNSSFPISIPLLYSGLITTKDTLNLTNYALLSNPDQLTSWDMSGLFSSQALLSGIVITPANSSINSLENLLDNAIIHLPLNQFGLEYSIPQRNITNEFHWISEFSVIREMHEMVNTIIYPEGYKRYASILELNGIYIVVFAETWAYCGEYLSYSNAMNITNPFDGTPITTTTEFSLLNVTNRVNAFQISLHIINERTDRNSMQNISLISYFKADLFLNETGVLGSAMFDSIYNALDFSQDDNLYYDPTDQLIWIEDQNNASNSLPSQAYAAMGYHATTHPITRYAMGDALSLLVNITLNHSNAMEWNQTTNQYLSFSSENSTSQEFSHDPGFAVIYSLQNLEIHEQAVFQCQLGMGQADSYTNALTQCRDHITWITHNITQYNTTDLVVFSPQFPRIAPIQEEFRSTIRIMNIGTLPVAESQLVFFTNYSTGQKESEIFAVVSQVSNLLPFQLEEYTAEWVPLKTGIYEMGWLLGSFTYAYELFTTILSPNNSWQEVGTQAYREQMDRIDCNLLDNGITRRITIINGSYYNSLKFSHFTVYPFYLDLNPMRIYSPLDYAIYNLTCLPLWQIPDCTIAIEGLSTQCLLFISNLSFSLATIKSQESNVSLFAKSIHCSLDPYTAIPLILFGHPLTPPGMIRFNITFSSTENPMNQPFFKLPVEFRLSPARGRIWFDATHLNLFVSNKIQGLRSLLGAGTSIQSQLPSLLANQSFFGSLLDLDLQNIQSDGGFRIDNYIDLSERLDTAWGNFFNLRNLWSQGSSNQGKGASLFTVLPIITLNISEYTGFSLTGFSVADLIPETSFLGNTLGNYSFRSDVLNSEIINHDLLQFFDGLILNDPEQGFLPEEIADIECWVKEGGVLMVWAEDYHHCNISSLNILLNQFGMTFSEESFYPSEEYATPEDEGLCYLNVSSTDRLYSFFQAEGSTITSIVLKDPLKVIASSPQVHILVNKSMYNGIHGVLGITEYGRGRVLAIGDHDLFGEKMISMADNTLFAAQFLRWGLKNFYKCNITSSATTLPYGKQGFVELNIQNYQILATLGLFEEGFLFVAVYFAENGTIINAELYGMQLPLLPLFHTDDSRYGLFFDSTWSSIPGDYYILILIDHPAATSELFYIHFEVITGSSNPPIQRYYPPDPQYSYFIDMIPMLAIVMMGLFLFFYESQKARSRLRIIPLQGNSLNVAKTRLNEGTTLFKQILRGIDQKEIGEIERVRFLLSNRKRLIRFFKDMKNFGDTIGEHY